MATEEPNPAGPSQWLDVEFLRGVLAASGDCIKVLDLDGNLVFMTDVGQKIMEVSDFNAIRGCPWPMFWAGQGNLDAIAAVNAAKAGETGHFQGSANTMAGTLKYWDVQVTPIFGTDRQPEKLLAVSRDITATHQAEQWLAGEGERLRGMFEQAPGFIAMLAGPNHVFELINPAYLQLIGHRDVAGKAVREALPDVEGQGFFELLDQVFTTGEAFSGVAMPVTLQRTPGAASERRYVDLVYQPIRNPAGEVTGIFAQGIDVTDRVVAEAEVRAREDLFRTFAQAMPNHIWTSPPNGQLDWFNDQVYEYSGVARAELDGQGWASIVHPEDSALAAQRWQAALATERNYETEFRLRRADGSYRWHIARARPIRGPNGAVERWIGTNTDIEEQKASAQALEHLNETLERRVEERTAERDRAWKNSRDLQTVLDTAGIFLAANEAWRTILGWDPAEVVGRSYLDFIHPEDRLSTLETLAIAVSRDLPAREKRYRHKDGTDRWISWVTALEAGLIYASGRHITAEKEAAVAFSAMQEQLRQSQKMEAVGQLTGGLAHDFNNLLTGITGSLELLQIRMKQGRLADLERYLLAAQGAAKRAAALTHRLLAFSRRQTLDPKPVNVNSLVNGLEDLIRRTMGPGVDVEVVGAAGLWTALIDPSQLENSLLNLCINARDAMPDGGRLTIETSNKWLDERAARERDLPPGQYLSLCVTDTGTGMSPETIRRAFDPFYTTKPLGEGTGLGLSMVYGFARQSGGQVRPYSEVGQGTTMCLYLPRHHGEGQTEDDAADFATAPRAEQGETVLVVDDEPTVRMLVTEVLEDLGYTAIEAVDGVSGLKVLASNTRVDLLITDVGLPGGMNGRQLADAARVSRTDLKVLFITGYAENAVVGNGHLDRGMEVLTKPFTIEALASRIKALIIS